MGLLDQIASNINALESQVEQAAAQDDIYEGTEAFFVPYGAPNFATATSAISTANGVRLTRFYLPMSIEVANVFINVVGTAASSTLGVGIYNFDGTELLLSGTASSASAGVKTISISPAVILRDGLYLFAWTCTSATPTCTSYNAVSAWNGLVNATNVHHGTGANASAAGVLPSTTGAITGSVVDVPLVKFEGA